MTIPFTQYLMPQGKQVPVTIDRPPEVEKIAHKVIEAGGRFEIEMLRTGEISITCECYALEDSDEGPTLAQEVCPNGPPVRDAVDKVVREAWRVLKEGDQ